MNKKDVSYLLKVSNPRKAILELQGEINNSYVSITIDPGATKSFISSKEAERLNLQLQDIDSKMKIQIASGQFIDVSKKATINFSLDKIEGQKLKEEIFIIEGDLPVIILGETFLISEELLIDYREAAIRINGHYIFLDEKISSWKQNPDLKIPEKAFVCLNTKPEKTARHRDLSVKYSQQNPMLGTSPNETMSIKLSTQTPIRRLPYTIPVLFYSL